MRRRYVYLLEPPSINSRPYSWSCRESGRKGPALPDSGTSSRLDVPSVTTRCSSYPERHGSATFRVWLLREVLVLSGAWQADSQDTPVAAFCLLSQEESRRSFLKAEIHQVGIETQLRQLIEGPRCRYSHPVEESLPRTSTPLGRGPRLSQQIRGHTAGLHKRPSRVLLHGAYSSPFLLPATLTWYRRDTIPGASGLLIFN